MRYLSMAEAAEAVSAGQLIVYPTETFFGVGGLALVENPVLRVYEAKKREPSEPLPVIIGHENQLPLLVEQPPEATAALLRALWPGPLSVIFPAKEAVPAMLTAGCYPSLRWAARWTWMSLSPPKPKWGWCWPTLTRPCSCRACVCPKTLK